MARWRPYLLGARCAPEVVPPTPCPSPSISPGHFPFPLPRHSSGAIPREPFLRNFPERSLLCSEEDSCRGRGRGIPAVRAQVFVWGARRYGGEGPRGSIDQLLSRLLDGRGSASLGGAWKDRVLFSGFLSSGCHTRDHRCHPRPCPVTCSPGCVHFSILRGPPSAYQSLMCPCAHRRSPMKSGFATMGEHACPSCQGLRLANWEWTCAFEIETGM